jgi:peptide/nickel transport system ATP-binding protein
LPASASICWLTACATWGTLTVADAPLLSVEELSVRSTVGAGTAGRALVDGISFDIGTQRVALVGESGSGKSLTARAIMGLLRRPLEVSATRLQFEGRDLTSMSVRQWTALRGTGLALILQDPRHALNPVLTVERQMDEVLRIHQREMPGAQRRERILEMLESVGLLDPRRVLRSYAHELSGGMGQRVMLAMMLMNGPRLLVADEPTSALDIALRDQVLELIAGLVETRRMGLLLISHDLQQVAKHCERVLVMYRGKIVDRRSAADVAHSDHPYTRMLWSCRPSGRTYGTLLPVIDRGALGESVPT